MANQLKPSKLKNPNNVKKLKSKGNVSLINGQRFFKSQLTPSFQIERGTQRLVDQGMATSTSSETSTEQSALNLLTVLGISLSSEKIDYSLSSQQTDTETIDNANIFDDNIYKKLKNKNIKATDKFVNENDPFYKLDNSIPNKNTIQNTELASKASTEVDLKSFASRLVSANLDDPWGPTLKEFTVASDSPTSLDLPSRSRGGPATICPS